jgi:hypothetical protein
MRRAADLRSCLRFPPVPADPIVWDCLLDETDRTFGVEYYSADCEHAPAESPPKREAKSARDTHRRSRDGRVALSAAHPTIAVCSSSRNVTTLPRAMSCVTVTTLETNITQIPKDWSEGRTVHSL